MGRVLRVDDKLRELDLPELLPNAGLSAGFDDVVIAVGGFEDRALEVVRQLEASKSEGVDVLLIELAPYLEVNQLDRLKWASERLGGRVRTVLFDQIEPTNAGIDIVESVSKYSGRIIVDISGMPRLLIVQLIVALSDPCRAFKNCEIVYCEAESYEPNRDRVQALISAADSRSQYRELFVSLGVAQVTVLPELSSISLRGQPSRLVVFPSFNVDQLATLSADLQPSFFTFLHGIPPTDLDLWKIDALKKLNHLDGYCRTDERTVSTLDYRETIKTLLDIYDQNGEMERIVISPTGSKMQAVAVGLFRAFVRDVQIVFPTPLQYAPADIYTKGVSRSFILPLSAFNEFLGQLD